MQTTHTIDICCKDFTADLHYWRVNRQLSMTTLFDNTRELEDDETVTETIVTADGDVVMGVDPFEPIDARLLPDDDFEPIEVDETRLSRF